MSLVTGSCVNLSKAMNPEDTEDVSIKTNSRQYEKGNKGRVKKSAAKRNYSKKRKYHPPKAKDKQQHETVTVIPEEETSSTSQQKVEDVEKMEVGNGDAFDGYHIMHHGVLQQLVGALLCPDCYGENSLNAGVDLKKKKGLASYITLSCNLCEYNYVFYTSPVINTNSESTIGSKSFDVNQRSVYAMRSVGLGHSALEKFCGVMNMPPPVQKPSYRRLSNKLKNAAKMIAEKSMADAARDVIDVTGSTDIGVSLDGTWQKRGFSSLNGVMVAVSTTNFKVLDIEVMSRHCKACNSKEKDDDKYEQWKISHKPSCNANYSGSAPGMETEGACRIFNRSVEKYGICYLKYYGDGDSKAFEKVEKVYPGKTVVKYECIGHYQKRVGNRLRKLRNRTKGLGGKNKVDKKNGIKKAKSRLTDSIIDKLQNYFGIALRSKVGNAKEMKDAILASMFHVSSSTDSNYHTYCPKSSSSWCQHNRDIVNGTNLYHAGPGLSVDVIAAIKPIYADLSKESVLEKCMHGLTQNANESFNATIWERCYKHIYCGLDVLELAVYDAVANYNYGRKATLDILLALNVVPGFYTLQMCHLLNTRRNYNAAHHSKLVTKNRRKVLRGEKKRRIDKQVANEGTLYEAGGF